MFQSVLVFKTFSPDATVTCIEATKTSRNAVNVNRLFAPRYSNRTWVL